MHRTNNSTKKILGQRVLQYPQNNAKLKLPAIWVAAKTTDNRVQKAIAFHHQV